MFDCFGNDVLYIDGVVCTVKPRSTAQFGGTEKGAVNRGKR